MNAGLAAALLLAPLVLGVSAAAAEGLGRARIVSAEDLAKELWNVSVLDARGEKAFGEGHVPGSLPMDWRDWTLEKPGVLSLVEGHADRWGKVPPADARLEERLRALGLSNRRPVVVVGDPAGWGEEGRVAWNLLYWGADDVALLEGGFAAWARSGRVEKGPARARARGDFALRVRAERRIEAEALQRTRATRPLLDARTVEEWNGRKEKGQKRGGHLPGARLVPYRSLYRADGGYVSAAELRALTGLERTPAAAPAAYCVGGVRSALLAVLLEARLGIVTANYDGSIWEWSSRGDLPLVTDPAP